MIVEDIAGWVAPVATAIAAIMTAANLGARVTGWGFVVFLVGSLAWSAVGAATGQTNLLLTNGFLTIVNLIGIWRWLGRQARYEEGGAAAAQASEELPVPAVRTVSALIGARIDDGAGVTIGTAIEAMLECDSGRLSYLVVRSGGVGGIGERLRAVPQTDLRFEGDRIVLLGNAAAFEALPDWVPEAGPPKSHTDAL